MPLSRLTHERYTRMRQEGTFPEVKDDPLPRTAPAAPPVPTRSGARSRNHHAYQVLAFVKRKESVDVEFLVEYPKLHDAILAATIYPFAAFVVNCHGKREYGNGKAIEVERT